ncbi:MFS general substrate transporter [Acaromyces ingoldii]|uniref:MFS general substrate transporter n=1 Tax=Acaromyces ingoldii TaxID=215250 RepID=A0A316YM33_9BASI|nr:MFS general substrate transporter [Acaromyces ingoldii]PWN88795.1 MFS general substrate transporter [Acaromyces ingoldii]
MDQNSKSDVQAFVPLGNKTIDAALALANEGPIAYEASEGRALLRKLDLRLIPLLCWVYALQFADKTTLNYASVMGVREDTHLTGQEYSYVSSIFYAGYIAAQPFIAYSLKRFSLGKFTAINVSIWGAILACHAACTSYAGLMIARSLLGAFEAVITPAFLLFVSVWYPRSQQARRVGYWLCCNGVATLICAPIAFGLSGITPGTLAIDSWQILFLLFGLVTTVTGVVYWFVLPDTQANAKFLSHREKRIAIDLIRENFQGVGSSKKFDRAQLREAFVDPATYLIFFFSLFMNIPNGGVTTFGSLVIKSFGFTSRQALLLGMPGGFVDLAFKLVLTRLSDRFNDRTGFAMIAIFFPFLGGLLMITVPFSARPVLLLGYYFISAAGCAWGLVMTLISNNSLGYTKKLTVSALQIIAYGAGNWIGPNTFQAKEAPGYHTGKTLVAVFYGLAFICLVLLRLLYHWRNKQRDREAEAYRQEHGPSSTDGAIENEKLFADETDFEKRSMRYML